MNVPQEDLNLWRRFSGDLQQTMSRARRALAGKRFDEADGLLERTQDAAARLSARLERAGAEPPTGETGPRDVPLRLLDSAANKKYADALRAAWEAGLEVDRERYGESIGTDGEAQAVEMLLADVEMEIYGPAGRGKE